MNLLRAASAATLGIAKNNVVDSETNDITYVYSLRSFSILSTLALQNWRPQLLTIVEVDENGNPVKPQLLSMAAQLKKGRGLNMIATIVKGDVLDNEVCEKARDAR